MPKDMKEVVHFFDIIEDHHGEFDWDTLKISLERPDPDFDSLPVPLKPKTKIPHEMVVQIAIYELPNNPKHYMIFKWFQFINQGQSVKGSTAVARNICVNPPFMMNMLGCGQATASHFHYIFENMGKWQARNKSLAPRAPTKEGKAHQNNFFAGLTDEEIDDGFNYLISAPEESFKQL
eukprot:1545308-Alexandrium_andersonii.AAC.1